jgi:beta-aspartyl-peptidase (threonine type)
VDARLVTAADDRGPVLVVHGGAGALPCEEDRAAYLEGVRGALTAGLACLLEGGAAEAVCAAVNWLECHTITNAGRGAALAADGSAILDAGFMDGTTRRYGGVTGVRRCMTPVLLARKIAEDGDYGRFVGAPESDLLPALFGVPSCEPGDLITDRTRRIFAERGERPPGHDLGPWLDTVGAVALDAQGRLAAAVSTGGMSRKRLGRIGDSPVVGGGYWADDRVAACVTTGVGEVLMRQGTARRCVQLFSDGLEPAAAAALSLDELVDYEGDRRGTSGLILVTADGRVLLDHNSVEMSGGWMRPDGRSEVSANWAR